MSDNRLWYIKSAKNWNEALPLGNGRIGAMVYGSAKCEKICLNEDTLWSGYPRVSGEIEAHEVYFEAQYLMQNGYYKQAQDLIENRFGDFLVQMYLPLGDMDLTMSHEAEISNYQRELLLDNAVHTVRYTAGGKQFQRESVISAPAQVFATKITCSTPQSVGFSLCLSGKLKSSTFVQNSDMIIEGNCPICLAPYGEHHGWDDKKFYFDDDACKGVGYRAAVRVVTNGGMVDMANSTVTVENADMACIYFAIRTSFNGYNKHPVLDGNTYKEECILDLDRAVSLGYDVIKADSIKDYRSLYDRVSLNLGESDNSRLPTDERLIAHAAGIKDNALHTLLFNYGRYLTIASSREGTQATNLQGIWNDQLIPPWSSNYTLNINTEMNYWPTLQCRLKECYQPLIQLVKDLSEAGQKTAIDYYLSHGFVSHHATDLWRVSHPNTNRLKGSTQWGFWCMSGGWLVKMLYDYYEYTGDREYLKEIYPVLLKSAEFYKDLLIEDDQGKLVFCPSTSPENNYLTKDGEVCPLDITTTMTMAIIRDVFECVVKSAEVLAKNAEEYVALLPCLLNYRINKDGTLNEWYGEYEDVDVHHRHVSHLYGLFPSNQINTETPELKEACKKTLLKRGDGGTGWSLAWKINLWARLRDGNHALKLLDNQLKPMSSENSGRDGGGGSYPNLFCAHPPFQIDGNFGACSGIVQMLLQCDGEQVNLLPALPDDWQNGEVKGLAIYGGSWIDFNWENGKVVSYKIHHATGINMNEFNLQIE